MSEFTSKYKPVTYIPDLYANGIQIQLSEDQMKNIEEYAGICITPEGVHNINRCIAEYLVSRIQHSQRPSYADIRCHSEKVNAQSQKLIDLLSANDETSYYFQAFIDGANDFWLKDFKIENIVSNLEKLQSSCNFWTHQKAKRSANYSFNNFIHHLKEIFLRMGGNADDFPTGASKLQDTKKNSKEFNSLFVDFVERVIIETNEKLTQDNVLAKQHYTSEEYSNFKNWYEEINLPETQSLAKAIQRALTDKPLKDF